MRARRCLGRVGTRGSSDVGGLNRGTYVGEQNKVETDSGNKNGCKTFNIFNWEGVGFRIRSWGGDTNERTGRRGCVQYCKNIKPTSKINVNPQL